MEQKIEDLPSTSLEEKIESMDIGSAGAEHKVESTKNIIRKYKKVFCRENKGNIESLEHKLELSDNTPIRQWPYKTDLKSQEIIDDTVEELLQDGIITESDSDWA